MAPDSRPGALRSRSGSKSKSKSTSARTIPATNSSDSNVWAIAFSLAILAILFSQEISDYFHANDQDHILKLQSALRSPNLTAWSVVPLDSRGGGYGVVAQRDILPGELIMKESPLIRIKVGHESVEAANRKLENVVQQLSGEDRIRLLSLSNAWDGQGPDGVPFNRYSGILQTNGMASGHSYFSVFPSISRLNHACTGAVNAVYNWRENEKVQVVHVTKPIAAGEEIFVSYIDSKLSRAERQLYIKSTYRFDCTCHICSLDPEESRQSDFRITKINSLKASLSAWSSGSMGGADAINLIEEAVRLMREEGMSYEFGQLYADASHVATAHSDFQSGRLYAKLAAKHFEIEVGPDSVEVAVAQKLIKNPTSSQVWGSRTQETVKPIN